MSSLIDPTAAGFLFAENRTQPMHVGGLHLYEKPPGAGRTYAREFYEQLHAEEIAPLFLKHPRRSRRGLVWDQDETFDFDYHVRHSALPKPGRFRELFELTSRLHSTRLAWERPLWEAHLIEGLRDGRLAMYVKTHHALVDGVSAMRLLQSMLSTEPDRRNMPPIWSASATAKARAARDQAEQPTTAAEASDVQAALQQALRTALGLSAEAAGMPGALVRTITRSLRNETSALSLFAPRTIFNQRITGARRFAAQHWELERLKAIGGATGTTINDVVLAMVSGAVRSYLIELDALPEATLIGMVPVGLNAKQSQLASTDGGNAVGSVMVQLGTHLADPQDRLRAIHHSMRDGKEALAQMTPTQIVAMSGLGQAPAVLGQMLGVGELMRPPYNLVISNIPGPRVPQYFNGARLTGMYPLSIPINGMALNITCTSYDGWLCFGLTGCRRTVPRLQLLLTYLDAELKALEKVAGV